MQTRIRGYGRVSTLDQATNGTSLDAQREEVTRYAASTGAAFEWYADTESGSGNGEDRLEQRRLMADLRAGDLVVVAKQDRWSRSTAFFLNSMDEIVACGARFFSLAERFDPSTPEGEFTATVMAAVAQQERARIRERTQGARIRLRAQGLWVDSAKTLGFVVVDRRPVIVEAEAIVVRRMFHLAANGASTRAIASKLRVEHPETPGLDSGAIGRRLRDRRYIGESPTAVVSSKKRRQWSGWTKTHEPIVDPGVFAIVQAALASRVRSGRKPGPDAASARFLLRSIVRCDHCGRAVECVASHSPSSRRHDYYACRWCSTVRKRRDESDDHVETEALARLEKLASRLAKATQRKAEQAPDFAAARAKVQKAIARLVAAVVSGAMQLADVRSAREALERDMAAIDAEEAIHLARSSATSRAECLAEVTRVRECWHALTLAEKRDFVDRLVERVALRRKDQAKKWERGAVEIVITWEKCAL